MTLKLPFQMIIAEIIVCRERNRPPNFYVKKCVRITRATEKNYIFRSPDHTTVIISKQNMALRRCIVLNVVLSLSLCLALDYLLDGLCRSLGEEIILSHCVRVNHDLFTEWIIRQLHTERCAWWDENSALRWHHNSVITHWESCYLQIHLKVVNSCCSLSLSDFPIAINVNLRIRGYIVATYVVCMIIVLHTHKQTKQCCLWFVNFDDIMIIMLTEIKCNLESSLVVYERHF